GLVALPTSTLLPSTTLFRSNVVILGGGTVGTQAAWMAAGLGAHVAILDINLDRLRYLDDVMPKNVTTVYSNAVNIHQRVKYADLDRKSTRLNSSHSQISYAV